MMDPTRTEAALKPAAGQSTANDKPSIDIFAELKSAPAVSPELLKEVGIDDKPTKEKPVKPKPAKPIIKLEPIKEPAAPVEEAVENVPAPVSAEEIPVPDENEDPETDKAVDDIVKSEADQLLAADDRAASRAAPIKHKRVWPWVVIAILMMVAGVYLRTKHITSL